MKFGRSAAVGMDQGREVEPWDGAVLDHPATADHHPVGARRAAQDERGQRVAGAGEAQLIEPIEREIGL